MWVPCSSYATAQVRPNSFAKSQWVAVYPFQDGKWSCGSVWFNYHFSMVKGSGFFGVHDDWQKTVLWHKIFLFPMRFLHGIKIPKVIMPRLSCWGLLSRRLGGSLFRKQGGCPSKLSRLSIRRFRITFQPFMFERRPTIRHPVDLSDR